MMAGKTCRPLMIILVRPTVISTMSRQDYIGFISLLIVPSCSAWESTRPNVSWGEAEDRAVVAQISPTAL